MGQTVLNSRAFPFSAIYEFRIELHANCLPEIELRVVAKRRKVYIVVACLALYLGLPASNQPVMMSTTVTITTFATSSIPSCSLQCSTIVSCVLPPVPCLSQCVLICLHMFCPFFNSSVCCCCCCCCCYPAGCLVIVRSGCVGGAGVWCGRCQILCTVGHTDHRDHL